MKIKHKMNNINPETFMTDYLTSCGIDNVKAYLAASRADFQIYSLYPRIQEAVEMLDRLMKPCVAWGVLVDKDMDGVCSATLAIDWLEKHGCDVKPIIRAGKAHGLRASRDENIVESIKDMQIGALWIPDAGSNDSDECADLFSETGTEILITDHHIPEHPNNNAIVINNQSSPDLNHDLTGTGVTYKVIEAYADAHKEKVPNWYISMVAASLVSDMESFTNIENRAFMREAFEL